MPDLYECPVCQRRAKGGDWDSHRPLSGDRMEPDEVRPFCPNCEERIDLIEVETCRDCERPADECQCKAEQARNERPLLAMRDVMNFVLGMIEKEEKRIPQKRCGSRDAGRKAEARGTVGAATATKPVAAISRPMSDHRRS